MSYVALKPSYYQMFQPESAWHAGAPGWSVAPVPGWGENPNLVGPARFGVEGLGALTSDQKAALAIGSGYVLIAAGLAGVLYKLTRK